MNQIYWALHLLSSRLSQYFKRETLVDIFSLGIVIQGDFHILGVKDRSKEGL